MTAKSTLALLFLLSITANVYSQQINNRLEKSSDETLPTHNSGLRSSSESLSANGVTPCGGGSAVVVASGGCSPIYNWYSDSSATNLVVSNDTLITDPLYADSTFYLQYLCADSMSSAPLPDQTSVFNGNARGYWFKAPVDFYITGLSVPKDASSQNQSVVVMRFNNGQPPLWTNTTNNFDLLGSWTDVPEDTIHTCISVSEGDYIGILGNRGDYNSYAAAPCASAIGDSTVTFGRLGMQYPMSAGVLQNVFRESGGSISRIEMLYSTTASNTVVPVTVVVPDEVIASQDVSICMGDSIFLAGNYRKTAGSYIDTLTTIYGCDSILTTNVSYREASYTGDTLCTQIGMTTLSGGWPLGGSYSGPGISNSVVFDAQGMGPGNYPITYTYTDTSGCVLISTAIIKVDNCASLEESFFDEISIYPNPTQDDLFIEFPDQLQTTKLTLFDAGGKVIFNWDVQSKTCTLNLRDVTKGLYILHLSSEGHTKHYKIVRN